MHRTIGLGSCRGTYSHAELYADLVDARPTRSPTGQLQFCERCYACWSLGAGPSVGGAAPVAVAPAAAVEEASPEEAVPGGAVDQSPAAVSQSVADLDALLGELDFGDDAAAAASEDAGEVMTADSDLDALLASIEGDAETDESISDEGEMDPDLAALLAAL